MNQKHKKKEQARISSSILFIFKRPTRYDLGAKQSLFSCHEVGFCISLKHTKVDRESNWLVVYSAEKILHEIILFLHFLTLTKKWYAPVLQFLS